MRCQNDKQVKFMVIISSYNNNDILSHHLGYRQVVVVLFTRRERDQKVTAKLSNVINMFFWKKIRRFIQS